MSLPDPQPGLVIRYCYLWESDALAGREEGTKDRPCAVVLVTTEDSGERRVRVLPITHLQPSDPTHAVEIPPDTKRRLSLDSDRSWIVISELNDFIWPGYDLRPRVTGDASSVAYGFLPPGLFRIVRDRYLVLDAARRIKKVERT